jgi:hypothetical protein
VTEHPALGRWIRGRWPAFALVGLVLAAATVRIVLVRGMEAPVILCDEFIYSNVAKNVAAHGHYSFRGVPFHSSYVYPLLIAPAWLFDSMATTYALAKSIGAASMTLVAVPTYLWARRMVGPWHSLLAAALTLLLPAFFYAGLLMTEAAFLPAFVLVGFAIAAMLERPTLVNQLGGLAALVLAISIRVQGVVLVAVIPTAVLLKVVLDWRAGVTRDRVLTDLRRLWPTAVAFVSAAVLYVVYKEARGEGLATGLGPYQTLAQLHYPLEPSARWSVKHLAELVLALGYVPVAALIVLLWLGFLSGSVSNAERCFLAVVSATAVWLLAEIGAFSATVAPLVFERYTFYLEPLLLIGFVVWLARGLPRPVIGTVVAVVVPAALLLALNLDRYVGPDAVNGVTLASLYRFSRHLPGAIGELRWLIFFGVVFGAFMFGLCSKTVARIALPALLAGYLVGASIPAQAHLLRASRDARSAAGIDASWINQTVGRGSRVVYINTESTGLSPSTVLLQTEFWNPNVVGVYSVGAGELCGLYETPTTTDVATGRVEPQVPDRVDYAIAARSLPLAGRRIAVGGPADEPLALYRVGRSLRVGDNTSGVFPDGWMGGDASYTRYVAPRRAPVRLTVTVGRQGWSGQDVPGNVVISVGKPAAAGPGLERTVETRRLTLHRLEQRSFTFEEQSVPIRVTVHVTPTFSPSQFGQADARQLGAQVSFAAG